MEVRKLFHNIFIRNILGLAALFLVYYVSDLTAMKQRTGFNKTSPYIFLLLLYGWIVFHNRILFERLYLSGKRKPYFIWTALAMLVSSFNMHFILKYAFHVHYTLPHILSFWVYTITGLGVFVLYKHLKKAPEKEITAQTIQPSSFNSAANVTYFTCIVDGEKKDIATDKILYIESLENYVKIFTTQKTHLVRLSLKETEERLPKPLFIRISRSHIVNSSYITAINADSLTLREHTFKIGKVYKRYVEAQLMHLSK